MSEANRVERQVKSTILALKAEAMIYQEKALNARHDNREFDAQHFDGIATGLHKSVVLLNKI